MPEPQNNSQSADNVTDQEGSPLAMAVELGPNGLPVHPPAGDEGEKVDSNLILDTFFGEGNADPNSGEGQAKGSNSPDGQPNQGDLAPQKAAPAANEGAGSPQPGPAPTQQQPGKEQGSEGAGPAQTPGQERQPSPEAQSPAPGLSAEDRLALASVKALQEQNAQLIEQLRRRDSGGQQPQPQGQAQPGQAAPSDQSGVVTEPLRLTVPDNLVGAILGEDPGVAKQGMDILVSAVATNAVQEALKRVVPIIDQRMASVTQALQSNKAVEGMEEAYYEAFPAHKPELFKSLIQQVVQEKYQQFPHATWDADMINAVGATVNQRLTALGIDPSKPLGQQQQPQEGQNGQGQTQQQQQQGGGQPFQRRQPAPMLDSSTRADNKVPHDAGDFIRSTFA